MNIIIFINLIHKPISFPYKDALITQDNKAYIFSEYVNYVNVNYFHIIFKILLNFQNIVNNC